MDKIDIDGTPFSVLMDRAVKLKTKQVGEERRRYDKMPSFYQHSIFPHEDVIAARNLDDFDARLAAAGELKSTGNSAFNEGRFGDALFQYEKALSVFRYLENSNPNWKNQVGSSRDVNDLLIIVSAMTLTFPVIFPNAIFFACYLSERGSKMISSPKLHTSVETKLKKSNSTRFYKVATIILH